MLRQSITVGAAVRALIREIQIGQREGQLPVMAATLAPEINGKPG